jgi:hypothetical protein
MALTYANALPVPYHVDGAHKKVVVDITLDDTADPSLGYAVSAPSCGLNYFSHGIATLKTVSGTNNLTSLSFVPNAAPQGATMIPFDETPAAVAATLEDNVVRLVAWGN